ncbi:MAG TPA: FkbM family methyltransferase [Bacteroidales bacterium]|nr:FkbM family methyltransferase [Bacteroidales bacterium]
MYNLIFDIGANRGQFLKNYLSTSKKVVAVEGNPFLAEEINLKYKTEIQNGSLIVVNKAISSAEGGGFVDFYINNYSSGLSRITPPKLHPEDFKVLKTQQISYGELVDLYGRPDMVKIDLEGYDKVILDYMLEKSLLPDYIQFENCGLDSIKKLIHSGHYCSWNIVAQYNFKKIYKGRSLYNFNPFGSQIISPWLNDKQIVELYLQMPQSWFDIHAKKNQEMGAEIIFDYYKTTFSLILTIKKIFPHQLKALIKKVLIGSGFQRKV